MCIQSASVVAHLEALMTYVYADCVCLTLTTLLTALILHMWSARRLHTSSCPQWAPACRGVQPSISRLSTSTSHCNSTLNKARKRGGKHAREGEDERNIHEKKRQMLTSRYRSCVCGLMLTSGLRCSLWQRQRAELWPWCLGEVWECRPRPAQPRRPGAWSSPPPFWPYPRLFLWRTRGKKVVSKNKHGHTNTQANLIKYIRKKHCQFN